MTVYTLADCRDNDGNLIYRKGVVQQENRWWAFVQGRDGRHASKEELDANAALIAAAPCLYAALADLDDAFCSENRTKEDRFRSRQALIAARAALAKARGET